MSSFYELSGGVLDSGYVREIQGKRGGMVKGHTNETKKTLDRYGDREIISLKVVRTPLASSLNRLLNVLSLGGMKRQKKKHGFSDYFHLFLVANVGGKNVVMEKNERVNVSTHFRIEKGSQVMPVDLKGKRLTPRDIIGKTLERIGEYNFYQYRAFSLNCQRFINDLLQTVGLLTPKLKSFINQPVEAIAKEMSPAFKKVANFATDVGGWASKFLGKGVNRRNAMNEEELRAIAEALRQAQARTTATKAKGTGGLKGGKHGKGKAKFRKLMRGVGKTVGKVLDNPITPIVASSIFPEAGAVIGAVNAGRKIAKAVRGRGKGNRKMKKKKVALPLPRTLPEIEFSPMKRVPGMAKALKYMDRIEPDRPRSGKSGRLGLLKSGQKGEQFGIQSNEFLYPKSKEDFGGAHIPKLQQTAIYLDSANADEAIQLLNQMEKEMEDRKQAKRGKGRSDGMRSRVMLYAKELERNGMTKSQACKVAWKVMKAQ